MAYSPANPWNFPMYRAPGNYNNTNGDCYYTPANAITDFVDTASYTAIYAVFMPLGYCASSYIYNTVYPIPGSTYPHFYTLGKKAGGIDNNIFGRGVFNSTTRIPGIQHHTYDGTTYRGLTLYGTNLGYSVEGRILQIAASINGPAGTVQVVVNGQFFSTSPTVAATLNLHSTNVARMVLNGRANVSTDTFNANTNAEGYFGPLLLDDTALDLTPESADYNRIFDANGDFLWAGEDGALWLSNDGSTKPWYYSENFMPTIQSGTMSATFTQYNAAAKGHPYGSKNDFIPQPHMDVANAMPGIELLWDMSMPWGHHNNWISCDAGTKSVLRRLSTSYAPTRGYPLVEGRQGSVGFDYEIAGNYGYYTYTGSNPLCALPALATQLSMTFTMDFSLGNNETFGYRKIAGWGSSSSSANFRVTGGWTSESGRYINMAVYPSVSGQFYIGWTVPSNTGLTAWTWQWNNGVMKLWVNGVVRSTVDRSASTTQLVNYATQAFGFRDSTSSSSGNILHMTDFFMVNSVALTDQQIIDLHAALLGT